MALSMLMNLFFFKTYMNRKTLTFRTIRTYLLTWKSLMSLRVFAELRFGKRDIRILKEVLLIPDKITCSQRRVCYGLEGLCMLLKRLSYPCRYGDMVQRCAKPVPVLSMITNQMIDFVNNVHGNRVLDWNHEVLSPVNLQTLIC